MFDLVLCLGVLYHVASPVDLFNVMAATNAELLVIDTALSNLPGNAFSLETENVEGYRNAIEEAVVAYPTRGAISMLGGLHGYDCVTLNPDCITDWSGMPDYQNKWRRAFICSKSRSLEGLPSEDFQSPWSNKRGLMSRLRSRLR